MSRLYEPATCACLIGRQMCHGPLPEAGNALIAKHRSVGFAVSMRMCTPTGWGLKNKDILQACVLKDTQAHMASDAHAAETCSSVQRCSNMCACVQLQLAMTETACPFLVASLRGSPEMQRGDRGAGVD